MLTRLLRTFALLLGLGAALSSAAPSLASHAVSIDVGAIDVSDALLPGGEYRLPQFGVRNPGTEPTTYRVVVSYIDGQDSQRPDEAWFTFSPAELTLEPGEAQAVNAHISLPADAEAGRYAALIGPQIVADGVGAQVGAAAAARLTFTIAPSSSLDAFLRWLSRILGEQPWLMAIPVVIVLIVGWWFLRRRISITVARRT